MDQSAFLRSLLKINRDGNNDSHANIMNVRSSVDMPQTSTSLEGLYRYNPDPGMPRVSASFEKGLYSISASNASEGLHTVRYEASAEPQQQTQSSQPQEVPLPHAPERPPTEVVKPVPEEPVIAATPEKEVPVKEEKNVMKKETDRKRGEEGGEVPSLPTPPEQEPSETTSIDMTGVLNAYNSDVSREMDDFGFDAFEDFIGATDVLEPQPSPLQEEQKVEPVAPPTEAIIPTTTTTTSAPVARRVHSPQPHADLSMNNTNPNTEMPATKPAKPVKAPSKMSAGEKEQRTTPKHSVSPPPPQLRATEASSPVESVVTSTIVARTMPGSPSQPPPIKIAIQEELEESEEEDTVQFVKEEKGAAAIPKSLTSPKSKSSKGKNLQNCAAEQDAFLQLLEASSNLRTSRRLSTSRRSPTRRGSRVIQTADAKIPTTTTTSTTADAVVAAAARSSTPAENTATRPNVDSPNGTRRRSLPVPLKEVYFGKKEPRKKREERKTEEKGVEKEKEKEEKSFNKRKAEPKSKDSSTISTMPTITTMTLAEGAENKTEVNTKEDEPKVEETKVEEVKKPKEMKEEERKEEAKQESKEQQKAHKDEEKEEKKEVKEEEEERPMVPTLIKASRTAATSTRPISRPAPTTTTTTTTTTAMNAAATPITISTTKTSAKVSTTTVTSSAPTPSPLSVAHMNSAGSTDSTPLPIERKVTAPYVEPQRHALPGKSTPLTSISTMSAATDPAAAPTSEHPSSHYSSACSSSSSSSSTSESEEDEDDFGSAMDEISLYSHQDSVMDSCEVQEALKKEKAAGALQKKKETSPGKHPKKSEDGTPTKKAASLKKKDEEPKKDVAASNSYSFSKSSSMFNFFFKNNFVDGVSAGKGSTAGGDKKREAERDGDEEMRRLSVRSM